MLGWFARRGAGRRDPVRAVLVGVLPALGVLVGCDPGSFAPPPPPELSALDEVRSAPPPRPIELIPSPDPDDDRDAWLGPARLEAGRLKVIFDVNAPPPGTPTPAHWQAERVRSAPARGIAVLVVEPADDPDLPAALKEARDRGVKVLLAYDRPPAGGPAGAFPAVTVGPFEPAATKLAEAVRLNARASGLPEDGHVLIVLTANPGPGSRALADVLEADLTAAGVTKVTRVVIPGENEADSRAVQEAVEADPRVTAVLSVEGPGLTAALGAHGTLKARREFVVGGGVSFEKLTSISSVLIKSAGVLDRNLPALGRTLVQTAVRMSNGDAVEGVRLPVAFDARPTELPRPAGEAEKAGAR